VSDHIILKEDQHYVPKGWGYERWIVNNDLYCGKLLGFDKGKCCSWHYHAIKDEVLLLNSGSLKVLYSSQDDIAKADEIILKPGDAFHVPIGLRHRMVALEASEVYEFSTHHEDSDSIRLQRGD
jgi:quercetin dioxygenase-like cupin family protein